MRKSLLLLCLMVSMLVSAFVIHPSKATISTIKWLEPAYSGIDSFYSDSVTAYLEGSSAKLAVAVTHSPYSWINVTWVRIDFDWDATYSSAEASGTSTPIEINSAHSVFVFNIIFTVPSATTVSNLIRHSYVITVNFTHTGGDATFTSTGSDFAIYSTAQAEAQVLNQQVDAYPTSWMFTSSDAEVLWKKARNAAELGDTYYSLGAFESATTSYQSALDLYEQAFAAEKAYQTAVDTALSTGQSNYFNALANNANTEAAAHTTEAEAAMAEAEAAQTQADAAVRQADAALTNAYGWMAFGVGWILIGIGAVIYGLRKPMKPPA